MFAGDVARMMDEADRDASRHAGPSDDLPSRAECREEAAPFGGPWTGTDTSDFQPAGPPLDPDEDPAF